MKAGIPTKFQVEIPIRPKGGCDGADMSVKGTLPFIPTIGMHLMAVPGDDFREVEDVYWSQRGGLEVFFKFDEMAQRKAMEKLGWREVV